MASFDWTWTYKLLECSSLAVRLLFSETASLLFCSSISVVVVHLRALRRQVEQWRVDVAVGRVPVVTLRPQLETWRNTYHLVVDSVRCLDRCFGPALFFNLIFLCTNIFSSAFYFVRAWIHNKDSQFIYVVGFSDKVFLVFLTCYAADRAVVEVIVEPGRSLCQSLMLWNVVSTPQADRVASALRRLQSALPSGDEQVGVAELFSDVASARPKISVWGFLDLGPWVFVQVVAPSMNEGSDESLKELVCSTGDGQRSDVPVHPLPVPPVRRRNLTRHCHCSLSFSFGVCANRVLGCVPLRPSLTKITHLRLMGLPTFLPELVFCFALKQTLG